MLLSRVEPGRGWRRNVSDWHKKEKPIKLDGYLPEQFFEEDLPHEASSPGDEDL